MPSSKPRRGCEPPDLFRATNRERLIAAGWKELPAFTLSNWLHPDGVRVFTEAEALEVADRQVAPGPPLPRY